MADVPLPRTYLYVPGHAPAKLAKATQRGADALIVDLEDAVPMAGKDAALDQAVEWLGDQTPGAGPELWVRVNAGARRLTEVRALAAAPALTGLVLAKAESAAEVAAVADAAGEVSGGCPLMPMVETATAVLDARALAAVPGVRQLQIGEVDLAGDTGLTVSVDETELAPYRAMIVLASAAAGVAPPPGPVSREVRDLATFAESTRRVLRQGFHGRVCIHPAQVEVVHELLVPSASELADAQEVLRLVAVAKTDGTGVVLDSAGRLVDVAVVSSAERVVQLAQRGTGAS